MSEDTKLVEKEMETETASKVLVFLVPRFQDHPLLEMEAGPPRVLAQSDFAYMSTISHARASKPRSPTPKYSSDPNPNGNGNKGSGDTPSPFPNNTIRPLPDPVDPGLTLSSVGGMDEHVKYLKRAVMYPLKHQGSLSSWGIEPPKGIMFHGPPGTGKTLLAKALANELSKSLNKKFSFFYQKGGQCFGKYFGESQQNLQDLFAAANHYKPSIIFFDEIDGLCPDRSRNSRGGSEAYATVVTALLGLMDSVKRGEVFIIGATNRLDAIDSAIRRPGRFDKQLTFTLPCEDGRRHILGIHTADWPHDQPTGDLLTSIVTRTNGYTGADLEKACRDTVITALSRSGEIPPEDVHITCEDWATAVQSMKHSNSNVFGSTLVVPQPISSVLTPLVSNIVREIVAQLKPLIPGETKIDIKNLSRNSLFIWDLETASQGFTNHTIMNAVLSDPSIGKMTTYLLNEETLLAKMNKSSLMGAATSVIQQALNSDKPCILFIERIHMLEMWMKQQKMASTFYRKLKRLRGAKVLILATSVNGLADQSDDIIDLFIGQNRSYAMRMPTSEERRQFYRQVFGELIDNEVVPNKKAKTDNNNKPTEEVDVDYSEIFDEQLEQVVEITHNDIFDYILTLYEALNQIKFQWKRGIIDLPTLAEETQSIIDKHDADR